MKGKFWFFMILLCLAWLVPPALALATQPEVKYIGPSDLMGMLGAPNLVIIDTSKGWWTYDQKIAGSLVYPEEVGSWAPQLPKDKKIVLYCG
jgi:hypothetical protein